MQFILSLITTFFAGLLSFLSPCVLPLVPAYLCFLTGQTLADMQNAGAAEKIKGQRLAFCFVAGFSTIFICLGASSSFIGFLLRQYQIYLTNVAGILIIVMGCHFLQIIKISHLYKEVRFSPRPSKQSGLSAYLIGMAFAFGWTPCIGPILATVLAIASNEAQIYSGVGLLIAYSAGLSLPFLLAAFMITPFLNFLRMFKTKLIWVERLSGVFLILAGLAFLTGAMQSLSFFLLETMPFLGKLG